MMLLVVFVLHRVSIIFCHQEARLPQTDRATRYVSQILSTVETIYTTNPQQISAKELEDCS